MLPNIESYIVMLLFLSMSVHMIGNMTIMCTDIDRNSNMTIMCTDIDRNSNMTIMCTDIDRDSNMTIMCTDIDRNVTGVPGENHRHVASH
jgi:hypothetical protein